MRPLLLAIVSLAFAAGALGGGSVHTTWLWHLHQPNYWPDRRVYGSDHYENAWDTIQQQDAGRGHPNPELLRNIFSVTDRVKAYQDEPRNALGDIGSYLKSGAQVSYSGALMDNIQSLGTASQLGYGNSWYQPNREARGWNTTGGKPRMDLVNFTYHHSLAPFLSDETLEMELRIHRRQMELFWTTNPPLSRGYFPTETCFSSRLIPVLKRVGIDWSIIANSHLARACADFPVVIGSGGENCDLPNRADQLNPPQGAGNYQRISIERGCSPTQVMPFGFQLHQARHVDPETGAESTLIIVPSDQALGWRDSYSTWDVGLMDALAARNDPSKPALAMFAHDGDNAWSGGNSYYREWVKNFTASAVGRGYEPTTVEQFIADHPPASNDVVHVEDGGWVYADGDFGSPMFINWHWPPSYSSGGINVVDPSLGVSDKADNWRVILATENRVKTAQQISGIVPRLDQVRDPGSFAATANGVELAWHYYLGGLDSGFVYYGCNGDMCQRTAISQSNAMRNVSATLANPANDLTAPTMFLPQRHPWNPGGTNFGVQYSYRVTPDSNPDFWIWTYAYDVSGITNMTLQFRVNGTNPPTSDQFKIYAGGPLTGAWQSSNLTQRVVAPVTGVTPQFIADYYYARISGITNAYVDYYLSAADSLGNVSKSQLFHVWVDSGQATNGGGDTNGCNGRACVSPAPLIAGNSVTISYNPSGGPIAGAGAVTLHYGFNGWQSGAINDRPMTFNAASNRWLFTTNLPLDATQLDFVFNNGAGTWDNNSGADWHFAVTSNSTPQLPAQPSGLTATAVNTNQINLNWSAAAFAQSYIVNRDGSAIGTTMGTSFSDTGLATGAAYCYSVMATNSVGNSPASASICTNTPTVPATNYLAFVLDGVVDSPGYRVSTNGLMLFAAMRGTKLYVATTSPGLTGPNDHFLFLTDQLLPSATTAAPWAKSGLIAVASTKPYMATESGNNYVVWNNAPAGSLVAKSATSAGVFEAVIDLGAAFGAVPTNLYLAAAAYETANGGALVNQSPAGSGPNLEGHEFLVIPTLALQDQNSDGMFDRLDPLMGFTWQSIAVTSSNTLVRWNSMPGRSYQVMAASNLRGPWTDIAESLTNAGPLQLDLSFDEASEADIVQRFFRVKLLP